ncbi:MAG: STAS domain-containing protein, partial [Methylococcales bacterium]|nr:STAS domain-containing protein [Methylococcales bacterium]
IISVIATDLLIGVAIGILVKLTIHAIHGAKPNNLFKIHFTQTVQTDGSLLIHIKGAAVFSNFLALKEMLANIEHGKTLIFDKSEVTLIDHTVMEFFHEFQHDYEAQGGHCEFQGLDEHETFSDHPLAARRLRPV